jgi:putative membrane protein
MLKILKKMIIMYNKLYRYYHITDNIIVKGDGKMMYWWGPGWGHMGGYYGIFMYVYMFIWLVVLAGVFYLIIRLIRSLASSAGPVNRDDAFRETPLDILKRRYAAGEITKDQYDRMREDLKDN